MHIEAIPTGSSCNWGYMYPAFVIGTVRGGYPGWIMYAMSCNMTRQINAPIQRPSELRKVQLRRFLP